MRQATAVACLLLFCASGQPGWAQPKRFRPAPNYVQLGKPDQAEGRRILEDLRQRGIEGDHYLEFQLRSMPRKGAERIVTGRLWGARNERGPVYRVELSPGKIPDEHRLIVQSGLESFAWNWSPAKGGDVAAMGPAGLFESMGGTELTAFDLQMPFIFWEDFVFEGVTNLRGRPTHVFLVYPPAEIALQRPALTGVRMYWDTAYHALVQMEQIGDRGRLLRTISIIDLKKIDEQYIVKSIDLRNDETRDKTRFSVTAAALGLQLPVSIFDPLRLADPVGSPSPERVRSVGP